MCSLLRIAVFVLLLGTVGLCTIFTLPVLADTPPAAPPIQTHSQSRIQIQCAAIRARCQDVDDLGINFNLIPSERPSDNGLAQKAAETPRFAEVVLGPNADRMLGSLAQRPGSVVQTFSRTTADGQPAVFSLAGLHDPGVSAGSSLSVTPQSRSNGAITLSIVPHFNFVLAPGPGNPAAPVSVAAFPFQPTLLKIIPLIFTVSPKPTQGMHFGETLPLIPAPGDGRHEDPNATRLWVFLSATLLPNAKGNS